MRRMLWLSVAVAVLAAIPGCKRGAVVKDEKTFELEPTVPHALYVPACKKFEVSFTTSDNVPISVYVMSKEDGDESIKASTVMALRFTPFIFLSYEIDHLVVAARHREDKQP